MIQILRLSGIGLIGAFVAMILKERYRSAGILVAVAAFLLISTITIGGGMGEAIGTVKGYVDGSGFATYGKTLIKALGISYITSITEGICNEAGEQSIGAVVLLSGKVQLLLLALPLAAELLEIASELV